MTFKDNTTKDLSVTALYTSYTWFWAGFRYASLFISKRSRNVYHITNAFRAIGTLLNWRLPSLRYSLAQRHALIDQLVEAERPKQIIEIAAGLSRRGATYTDDPSVQYTDIDMPHVVEEKIMLFKQNEQGRAILERDNYNILSCDAFTADLAAWLEPEQRAVVIAEGLMIYLSAGEQRELWLKIAKLQSSTKGITFIFDFVPAHLRPKRGFFGVVVERLIKVLTKGGTFVRDERTVDDIRQELYACNFVDVETYFTHRVAKDRQLPGHTKRTSSIVWLCRI